MRRWLVSSVGFARVAGSAVAAVTAGRSGAETMRLRPDDPKEVAMNRQIYAETCASCHGA